jgi:hypothetical protein
MENPRGQEWDLLLDSPCHRCSEDELTDSHALTWRPCRRTCVWPDWLCFIWTWGIITVSIHGVPCDVLKHGRTMETDWAAPSLRLALWVVPQRAWRAQLSLQQRDLCGAQRSALSSMRSSLQLSKGHQHRSSLPALTNLLPFAAFTPRCEFVSHFDQFAFLWWTTLGTSSCTSCPFLCLLLTNVCSGPGVCAYTTPSCLHGGRGQARFPQTARLCGPVSFGTCKLHCCFRHLHGWDSFCTNKLWCAHDAW